MKGLPLFYCWNQTGFLQSPKPVTNKHIRIRTSTFPFPENKLMYGGKENGFNHN